MLFNMTEAEWDAVIAVHLKGTFNCSRAASIHMREQATGRIISMSSVSALGSPGQPNYAAAKMGIVGLTYSLAQGLARYGVTANAIAPGFIETEMTAATAERIGVPFEDFKKHAAAEIPVARTGRPEDIAHAVSFFASEGAGFVSGQVLYVAGGPKG
jgi:3-oxoacyl-[acyl-carrier protein] reductase